MLEERRLTIFSFGNSLLASIMVVSIMLTLSRFLGVLDASWRLDRLSIWPGLVIGAFLVALEVQWTRRLLERRDVPSREWFGSLLAEWGLCFFVFLVMMWIELGSRIPWQGIPALPEMAVLLLTQPPFIAGLLLLCLVWIVSRYLTKDLMTLEDMPIADSQETMRGVAEEQSGARNRLWQDIFIIGGFLVFFSIFKIPVAVISRAAAFDFGSIGWEILLYFLCGFGLLALCRLMLLRAEWKTERTGIDSALSKAWIGYAIVFVLALLFLAVMLPTDYSFQLLGGLNIAIAGISWVLSIVTAILLIPLVLLMSLLMSLLGQNIDTREGESLISGLIKNAPPQLQGASWDIIFRQLLFWGVVIFVLVYAIRQILPLRTSALRRLAHWPFFRRILDFLFGWRKRWGIWKKNIAETVRESLQAIRRDRIRLPGAGRTGFLNLRGLNPRQRIRFYFFALLRRGSERGIVRRPAQTPREYLSVLSAEESQIGDELQEMTLAFEEARYTVHDVDVEKARRVKSVWETIRAAMRAIKIPDRSNGKRPG